LSTLQEGKGKAAEDDLDAEDDDLEEEGSQKPLTTTFELNDTLYAEAELEDTDTVFLWLGVRLSLYSDIYSDTKLLGKRHVVLQNPCRDHSAQVKTGSCRAEFEKHHRRSRIFTGTNYRYGGKHRSGIQLGRQAAKREEAAGTGI
jgi:hypothetical protein